MVRLADGKNVQAVSDWAMFLAMNAGLPQSLPEANVVAVAFFRKQKTVSKVSNHYAAMPSMHAGYSLWCSLSMYEFSPFAILRSLAVFYPLFTLYCIVVTVCCSSFEVSDRGGFCF